MSFDPAFIISRAQRGGRRRLFRPPFGKLVAFAAISISGYVLVAFVLGEAMHALDRFR